MEDRYDNQFGVVHLKATAFLVIRGGKILFFRRKAGHEGKLDVGGAERHQDETMEDSLTRLLRKYYLVEPEDYTIPMRMSPTTHIYPGPGKDTKWEITLNIIVLKDGVSPRVGCSETMEDELLWLGLNEIPLDDLHPFFKEDFLKFKDVLVAFLG